MEDARVDLTILSDRNAVVVEAEYTDTRRITTATGSSKRAAGEVYDKDTGDGLAVARALVNLGHELEDAIQWRLSVLASGDVPLRFAMGGNLVPSDWVAATRDYIVLRPVDNG